MSQQSDPSVFESQYKRTLEIAGCKTQLELAELLGIRQSSISDAKRRQSIPSDWLVKLFTQKRVNPDWILCGEGGKYLTPTDAEPYSSVVRVMEVRPVRECSMQELFSEMVRRVLQEPNLAEIQKEVANSWHPVKKTEGEA